MNEPRRPEPVRDLDWEPVAARAFGEQVLDIWQELLERLPELPVARRHDSQTVHDAVIRKIPHEPVPVDELVDYLRELAFEHSMYPGSPSFMAYVSGPGTVPGAPAELLAAGLNQNLGGWRLSPAATEIEIHLAQWFAREFGLPEGSGGVFASGGAMANFIGLKAARDEKAGWDTRLEGVQDRARLTIYASEEVHGVIDRAADMMGLGERAVRHIPTDDGYRMRIDELKAAIDKDRSDGLRPIAIVGSAGTVATGSIDPLEEIAELCKEHDLWFHVDGAYGALASLAPDLEPLFKGLEAADSIAFDPHKWLYTSHSGGCVVLRDFAQLHDAFVIEPSYVHADPERSGHGLDLRTYGPQFSRGFQGLKIWVSLLAHGRGAYERRISQDVALARYLALQAETRSEFEPVAPVTLSIACFRYVPPNLREGEAREPYLNLLNERLMTELQLDGRSYCSNAVLRGKFVLRACIVNFRTEAEHIDRLLDVSAELGAMLDAELRPAALR